MDHHCIITSSSPSYLPNTVDRNLPKTNHILVQIPILKTSIYQNLFLGQNT